MKTIIMKFIYSLAVILSVVICSCKDDFTFYDGEIPDGEGTLSATVTFTPATGVNLAATRTYNGDVIRDIESLCVLIYDTQGQLLRTYDFSGKEIPNRDVEVDDYYGKGDENDNQDEPHTAETTGIDETTKKEINTTRQVKVELKGLPYGKYKIYAVANMDDLATSSETFTDVNGKIVEIKDAIQTEEGLRNIKLTWSTDIPENNQMFGYFTSDNSLGKKFNDPAPTLTFTQDMEIHSWLNRVVSKLTVAFDASGLNQGVAIYIKSVTLRDFPKTCLLGNPNKPGEPERESELLHNHLDSYNKPGQSQPEAEGSPIANSRFEYNENGIITNPEEHTGTGIKDGYKLENMLRQPVPKGAHAYTSPSLFFFENMQGDFEGDPKYDKRQQTNDKPDGVGTPIRDKDTDEDGNLKNDFKDKVKYGTYVEVEAYYISENPGRVGEGYIKYRFMLGKNVTYNYDVQRNYHLKLTLGFKGWANQPDWHIDYEQPKPGIEVQPEFRVSYLYNQKSELPIRILDTENAKIKRIDMRIVENNWAPYDPDAAPGSYQVPDSVTDTEPNSIYAFRWNRAAYMSYPYMVGGKQTPYYGFLALHLPPSSRKSEVITTNYSLEANRELEAYYIAMQEGVRSFVGEDALKIPDSNDSDKPFTHECANSDDNYDVIPVYDENGDRMANQRTLMVPLWTRAKTLIAESGFSGNNPYEGYERKATLEITATFEITTIDEEGKENTKEWTTDPETVDVFQVKRLINPKGVWRASDRNDAFHVTLLEAENGNDMCSFTPFPSEGEWTAFIDEETNTNAGFYLTRNSETVGYQDEDGKIHGYTGSSIHFDINFDRVTVSANAAKCAIVKVLYHGNQCMHKIMVRKGYDQPVKMGGQTWSSFSLYQATLKNSENITDNYDEDNETYEAVLTKNPLMLGSMFRRGRLRRGIFVINNMAEEGGVGPFEAPGNYEFIVGEKNEAGEWKRLNWTSIGSKDHRRTNTELGIFEVKDEKGNTQKYKVPEYEDFANLTTEAEFGFGVVYGSSAVAPAMTAADAYGLIDPYNEGLFDDPRGMRGVIAYSKQSGDQIFFPMGKYGTGRRNNFIFEGDNAGVLRYGDVNYLLTIGRGSNLYRPIPYNLMVQSGNIYWINKRKENGHPAGYDCLGWDMNYFNFDFNPYTANNFRDACPIKLIIVPNQADNP